MKEPVAEEREARARRLFDKLAMMPVDAWGRNLNGIESLVILDALAGQARAEKPQEPVAPVEQLRFVKRVMENWAGAPEKDRADAYWIVRDMFIKAHEAARGGLAEALKPDDRKEIEKPQDALDALRLDWLERQVVEVRAHLMWGSRLLFIASHFDEEDEDTRSDLRAKIDAAIAQRTTETPR
jgi:hypothetical protein